MGLGFQGDHTLYILDAEPVGRTLVGWGKLLYYRTF